jgi:hypothetical protein
VSMTNSTDRHPRRCQTWEANVRVTPLDVIGAYYHYIQNSFFGTATGAAPCSGMERSQCAGTFDAISALIDWRFAPKWDVYFGMMFSQMNSGLANGFLQRNNIDPTVGLRFRF